MKIAKSSLSFMLLSVVFVLLSVLSPTLFVDDYAGWRQNWWSAVPIALLALFSMFFLPIFALKRLFKDNPESYGLRFPENPRKSFWLTLAAILVLLPVIVFFGTEEAFQAYYSMGSVSLTQFLVAAVFASLIYYAAEEFLFRGFLFWGLWYKIKYHSFWVSALIFAFFHLTKPLPEVFFAFFAGLVFAYLSFKTKSFIPAVVAHFAIALILNLLIFFSLGAPSDTQNIFHF